LRVSSEPVVVKSTVKPAAKQEVKPEAVQAAKPEVKQEASPAVRPSPSSTNAQTARTYAIQPGDTLGRIARQYYGDPMQWSRIVEANYIQNPDLIYPGQVFLIP
jgi:nucleoid-associated protein YgaU